MSRFHPSASAEHILRSGRIIGPEETPAAMVERVTRCLAQQDAASCGQRQAETFAAEFESAFDSREIVMSTPIMTNAGRYADRPLTACAVPTVDIGSSEAQRLREEVVVLHEQGMGTGFNLDTTKDPVVTLRFLNQVAVDSATSGREDRPVGNMAILSVRHPKIHEFITAKADAASGATDWKFNISVDLDSAFMMAVHDGDHVELEDGHRADAGRLFDDLCVAAAACADPGVVFLDRMNTRNPIPGMGAYTTTAPCAEVGLIAGETCQFGYLNVGKFVSTDSAGQPVADFARLEQTTALMTRALDNCLAVSEQNLNGPRAQYISHQKRKIGIGLCGVADALSIVGLHYDSAPARDLMADILSFINFASKEASVRLAETRGPCGAMRTMVVGNRHRGQPGHIERLYGGLTSGAVAAEEWCTLSRHIAATGMLRNVSTIALPPTGRSALVIDASTGVEPHFDTFAANDAVLNQLEKIVWMKYGQSIYADHATQSAPVRQLLGSAPSISTNGHVAMAAALQRYTDEAIAKTINLPAGSTADDVKAAYIAGYQANLSGITVYVDGSRTTQPKKLR
ncbi:ribonucleotide reductase N-terminal alpha domain-containing protein [Nocardia sp. NPDC049737]|uniref:ribonucleotide reductase N-terminal alpha domain-containing protein n=1 Tax=Nocardia sp. NPDC049737 TaxID=3154358 RepID=UPI0034380D4E